jgi:hypothetical protein
MTQLAFNLTKILDAVEDATDEQWRADALAAVRRVCLACPDFISDQIWEHGLESTREDRALGPIMLTARKNGWCEKTNYVRPSKRRHGSGKPVWRSLIYRGGA